MLRSSPHFYRRALLVASLIGVSVCAVRHIAADDGTAARPGYFSRSVFPLFETANCRGCHNADGVASATRLHFPEPGQPDDRIEAFGKSLVALVDPKSPEQSLLLNKPTNRIPHTGGKRIAPASKEEALLLTWVRHLAGFSDSDRTAALTNAEPAGVKAAPVSVLRRLTHSQYNHAIRDLLGDDGNHAGQFPPEDFVNGFKNQFQAQSVSPLLEEAYSAAAEKIARNAFRGGDTRGLIPCKPAAAADAACRDKFIREFGLKAFRRPLLLAELQRYSQLFARQARQTGTFNSGAQLVVEAMLQSPNFLFYVENGSDPRWASYEAASRLSYFLWDSMPDGALFRSAEKGELATPAGIEKAARRLLADPRARRSLDEFVSQWLRFDRVLNAVKDRRQFPQFTPELAFSMTEEARRFLSDLVWNDRNFLNAFTADYTFLNGDLATLYNVPAAAGEFERVTYPADSDRAGLTGQSAFLTLTSKPSETSPTARGLFVREQFLCQHVPEPPPGVNTNLPPLNGAMPQTNRERLAMHLNNESCAGCHNLIDPIGFGLEKFDAIGKRTEKLKLTFYPDRQDKKGTPKSVELPIDASGRIAGIADSSFTSPKELGRVLAASPQCRECVVKQLFRYASGRLETPADGGVIRRSVADFEQSQFKFKELMIAIAKYR